MRAIQLKILHRAQISPAHHSQYRADLSPLCSTCKTEIQNLTHCFWFCHKIQRFWCKVNEEMNNISEVSLVPDPAYYLLGIFNHLGLTVHKTKLFNILTFCARKCLVLLWITDKAPTIKLWNRIILEYVSLDYLTWRVPDKDAIFH